MLPKLTLLLCIMGCHAFSPMQDNLKVALSQMYANNYVMCYIVEDYNELDPLISHTFSVLNIPFLVQNVNKFEPEKCKKASFVTSIKKLNLLIDLVVKIQHAYSRKLSLLFIFTSDSENLVVPTNFIDVIVVDFDIKNLNKWHFSDYLSVKFQSLLMNETFYKWNKSKNSSRPVIYDRASLIFKHYKRSYVIKAALSHCPPFVRITKSTENRTMIDGFEHRIFEHLFRGWRKSYVILDRCKTTSVYDDIFKSVADGEADLGMCSLWQEATVSYFTEMAFPHYAMCATFLVPVPKSIPNFYFVFYPLSMKIIGVLTIIKFVLFNVDLEDFFKNKRWFKKSKCSKTTNIKIFRLLSLSEFMVILLLSVNYSAEITSILTKPPIYDEIGDLNGLIKNKITWEAPASSYYQYFYGSTVLRKLSDFYKENLTRETRENLIRQRKYSRVVKKLMNNHLTDTEILRPDQLARLALMPGCFTVFYIAFALRYHFPLYHQINDEMHRILEHGFVSYWYREFVQSNPLTSIGELFSVDKLDDYIYIDLAKFQGAIYILLLGYALSIVVFVIEYTIKSK